MSTIAGKTYSTPKNINLKYGILRFNESKSSNPLSNDDKGYGLYVNSSNQLVFWNKSATTILGSGGDGGVTPTWETIFEADNTFTITPDATFTIAGNRATATDVLTFTNAAGGSGDVVKIQNAGSGADISGTSDTWTITKAGVITATGLTLSGANTITSTGGDITWTLEDNDATALTIGPAGATSMMTFLTTNGSEAVVFGNDITLTDGKFTATSTSNTAPLFLLQNDTITTFGNGATEDQGAFVFSSDTLTTGDLIRLQLDESALVGGAFLKAVQTDGATSVFTIGENGATTIAGDAAGTDALAITAGDITLTDGHIVITEGNATLTLGDLTLTAGDFTMTVGDASLADGSLTIVDADNAATLSVTNDTATTATVFEFAGSGVFTGSTTNSFMTVTPSGLTTGTALYMPLAGLTTGKGLHVSATAMTSGTAIYVDATEATLTTGKYLEFYDGAANDFSVGKYGATVIAGNATGTDALTLTAGDITLTSGDITLTDGDIVLTANSSIISFTGTGANGGVLKNLKNAAASGLSGTQKDIEIDIGGVAYYFTVYPTKA